MIQNFSRRLRVICKKKTKPLCVSSHHRRVVLVVLLQPPLFTKDRSCCSFRVKGKESISVFTYSRITSGSWLVSTLKEQ